MPNFKPSADVDAWSKDWRRLQAQKHRQRGGVEARMLLGCGMYFGEQFMQQARDTILTRPLTDDDRNKLFLVFNLIKKACKRKMGRLWAASGVNNFYATPDTTDPTAYDQADVVNKAVKALNKKLREQRQHWARLWWMVNTGVCVEHTPWIEDAGAEPIPAYDETTGELLWKDAANDDPNERLTQSDVEQMIQMGMPPERFSVVETLQMVGDVGSHIVSPFNCFVDSATLALDKLGPDQAFYIVDVKTVDFVRETFGSDAADNVLKSQGKDLGIVKTRLLDRGPSVAGLNMKDLIPAIQGSKGPDDPPMCLFATRYQPACKDWPHGRRSMFVPDSITLEDDANEYGELPVTDFHFEAPTVTFWTSDYITDLVAPQKFLNKRMSQMGEAANAQLYEVLLLGPGLTKEDIPSDMPGVVEDGLGEDGSPKVQALVRGQLPTFFVDSIKLVLALFDKMTSVDLTDHDQFPGQLRGPMALPLLQEIVDSEDGPLYQHVGEQLAMMHQQRINRVKQFYPPIRTMHYTGSTGKDEVLIFHTQQILRAGTEYHISVDPGSLMPEFSALREARIVERLSSPLAGLYVDKRTGKIDFSKIAQELKYNDDSTEDRATQYRTLAKHLIGRLWQAETLAPEVPYAFWDHGVVLDELESAMATTEFLEASSQVKQNFIDFYERCRQFLAAIQESAMQAVQAQAMQGTIAQVSQQTAAKVASTTVDQAMGQIKAQIDAAHTNPIGDQLAHAMSAQGAAQGGPPNRLLTGPSRLGQPSPGPNQPPAGVAR